MTDPTQTIPASEVERWEREALELYPDKEFYDHYDYRSEADYAFREQREQEQAIRDSYIAGAKSEYLRRERWVSVKERLPEYMQCVIIHDTLGIVLQAQFGGSTTHPVFTHGDQWYIATHWQPLPEPPSEP